MTSKIKVDNINKVSDDSNIINKCGTTVTVGAASDSVRTGANNLQASDGGNLISQSGTTITLGASGDTITLASGASQTGFGRTGTVDWQTAIKTSTITAVNGEGYFVNTTGGAITANLPAGVVGAIVSFKDYAQTFDTNALTIAANGSEKIDGLTTDLILSTEGQAVTLVYGDATKGWQAVNSNDVKNEIKYVAASGGTQTTSGNFKIHTFTGPGTFTVSCGGNAAGSNSVSYLVIAGAGGGGGEQSGGGGAGGYREGKASSDSYTASPLNAPAGLPVIAQAYPITVGGGGNGGTNPDGNATAGSNSVFSSITSTGGGRGGTSTDPHPAGSATTGGSGGGGATLGGAVGASGNTPPVSPPQGNDGGDGAGAPYVGGGGGGAGAAGTNGTGNPGGAAQAGPGGNGVASSITGSPVTRAGGGGAGGTGATVGGNQPYNASTGGSGGGGAGAPDSPSTNGTAGTVNTGSGGGGGNLQNSSSTGGGGGSGIVIIRYRFQ
jgi:hypothetical protein